MSAQINTRKSEAENSLKGGKVFAILAWCFIGLGILLCITIIGLFMGIPLVILGCLFFIPSTMLKSRGNAILRDLAEENNANAAP